MKQIEEVIKLIDKLNLNQNWNEVLEDWIRTELTYTSNSLEGNTLTLIETSVVINDNLTVAGKSLREINEAINHSNAWKYLNIKLAKLKPKDLKLDDILKLHEMILNNIDNDNKGQLRKEQVRISGSSTILPNPTKVYDLIQKLIKNINNAPIHSTQDFILLAINTHFEFVKIHPFVDGNGRTGRLMMNMILKQFDLPPISINPKYRADYLRSLENSDSENNQEFVKFIIEQYKLSLISYLNTFDN